MLTIYSLSLYQSVLSNIDDATELLAESFDRKDVPEPLLEDALKCLQVSTCPSFTNLPRVRLTVTGMGFILYTSLCTRQQRDGASEATRQ